MPDISKEVVSVISTQQSLNSNTPFISGDDEVIYCVTTKDRCTESPSISADSHIMPTAHVITIDDTPMSSGANVIFSSSANGSLTGSAVSSCGVSYGPTQSNASGNTSFSTPYRSIFLVFITRGYL